MKLAEKRRRKPRFDTRMPASLIAGLGLATALLLWGLGPQPAAGPPTKPPAQPHPPASVPSDPPDCDIKGNISYRTGERIYHLPGQQYYEVTVIDPADGERWFCTEAEARANGWRKSKR